MMSKILRLDQKVVLVQGGEILELGWIPASMTN